MSSLRSGEPKSRGIQTPIEDSDRQAKRGRGSRRIRREDSQEVAEGGRQARRSVTLSHWPPNYFRAYIHLFLINIRV